VAVLVAALICFAGSADAEPCVYLDIGDDDDPWTLETETDAGDAWIQVVFEVPEGFMPGTWAECTLTEGCCDDTEGFGHYGVWCELETASFDARYVDTVEWARATCLCCTSAILWWRFDPAADLVVGERYILGEIHAVASCNPVPPPPCQPAHDVELAPTPDLCADPAPPIFFHCSTVGVPEEPQPPPVDPDVPDAIDGASWTDVKARYR
jgi:hypothetical protein